MARLLVIDDEPSVLKFFDRMFRALHHEPVLAQTGKEACRLAADPKIEVIFSDLNMNDDTFQGLALIRKLRELRPECPIVVVSGYPSDEYFQECEKLGVVDFLTKPFEMTFVSGILEKLLTP